MDILTIWEHLHSNAEISWEEKQTTAFLMKIFEGNGFTPVSFQHIPGFYVDIGKGKPVVGLRADMDALLQEVNGKLQANHSCGHDAHMAMVTGTMLRLKKYENQMTGKIRAIFQPAEEIGNGSISVVNEGIVDDLDYLFGVHVRPKNEIPFPYCAASIQHGACAFIRGKIIGIDHHGARPHEGVNAIEVGTSIVQHIQQIHTSPNIPASVKMTNFHAGTNNLNIIPGEATFGLDLRAQTNDVMEQLKKQVGQICEKLAELYRIKIEYKVEDEVPAATINQEAEQILFKAIEEVLGKEQVQKTITTPGSDDFHFYSLLRPQIKATMLALGADVEPGLHHPNMTFNKQAINNGIDILTDACLRLTSIGESEIT